MSKKKSKRYQEEEKKIDAKKVYTPAEALQLIKEGTKTKLDQSVEVHIRLGIDPKAPDQIVRGGVVLPHGTGQSKKIIAFVTPDLGEDAKKAGADLIGDDETINTIRTSGRCDFEVAVAVPQVMKKLGPVARILGQKGLMPNPKNETVTTNVAKTIADIKKGKANFRSDDSGNVHQVIGKVSFETKHLEENFSTLIDAIQKAKPDSLKGTFFNIVSLCSSMGPSIRVKP